MPGANRDYAELLARWKQIDPTATAAAALERQLPPASCCARRSMTSMPPSSANISLSRRRAAASSNWSTICSAPISGRGDTRSGAPTSPRGNCMTAADWSAASISTRRPRDGKFSHAALFEILTGLGGQRVPVGPDVTNFPATGPMDHGDVETFLHEFGHLIHSLYSGHQPCSLQVDGRAAMGLHRGALAAARRMDLGL